MYNDGINVSNEIKSALFQWGAAVIRGFRQADQQIKDGDEKRAFQGVKRAIELDTSVAWLAPVAPINMKRRNRSK
jgi:hypothetical protein